eukprot:360678-Chlamydomonas_euryale.AAC.1
MVHTPSATFEKVSCLRQTTRSTLRLMWWDAHMHRIRMSYSVELADHTLLLSPLSASPRMPTLFWGSTSGGIEHSKASGDAGDTFSGGVMRLAVRV